MSVIYTTLYYKHLDIQRQRLGKKIMKEKEKMKKQEESGDK